MIDGMDLVAAHAADAARGLLLRAQLLRSVAEGLDRPEREGALALAAELEATAERMTASVERQGRAAAR